MLDEVEEVYEDLVENKKLKAENRPSQLNKKYLESDKRIQIFFNSKPFISSEYTFYKSTFLERKPVEIKNFPKCKEFFVSEEYNYRKDEFCRYVIYYWEDGIYLFNTAS